MTPAELIGSVATGAFIDGDWVTGKDGELPVEDPSTGSVIAEVARASVDQCLQAVDAAAAAQPAWAATSPRRRSEVLSAAFASMTADRERLADLIVAENGKVRGDALAEVTYAAEYIRWYAEEAVRVRGELRRAPGGDKYIITSRQPIGVALLVTPWNFPAATVTRKIAPALAAGCSVVLKPAGETPLTALALVEHFVRAGVPAGVLNVVCADPPGPAVAAMMAHPGLATVSFTGSTSVGEQLLAQAASRVLRCSLELGGNAPFIVLAGADVEAAVDGAVTAKMRNGGTACVSANRFLVHESLADEFTDRLVARMGAMRFGPGGQPNVQFGPLITARERTRVAALVDTARDMGASGLTGGHVPDGEGYFYPATVLADVPPDAAILGTEIFGPVAPIVRFEDEDTALALANATDAGLVSYVYAADTGAGLRAARSLRFGMVGINRGVVSDAAAPFGGVKKSGIGREGGFEGIDEYLETQYIAADW